MAANKAVQGKGINKGKQKNRSWSDQEFNSFVTQTAAKTGANE